MSTEHGVTRKPALTVADLQRIAKWCFDHEVPADTELRGMQTMTNRITKLTIRIEDR